MQFLSLLSLTVRDYGDLLSLKAAVGGICGFDRKDRTHATQVIPIL